MIKINRTLAMRLHQIEPCVMSPEARAFVQHLEFLQLPAEGGPPAPGGIDVRYFRTVEDTRLQELVLQFRGLQNRSREVVVAVARALAGRAARGGDCADSTGAGPRTRH